MTSQAPSLTIRPFQNADASTVARLVTESVQQHWTYLPEHFREHAEPARVRVVAEQGGTVLATANFHPFDATSDDTLRLEFAGDETLYSQLYLALVPWVPAGVTRLLGVTREDWPPMRLFHAAGFRNAWQSWGAHLDLRRFDAERFVALEQRLFMEGFEVERLEPSAGPLDWAALYALHVEGVQDAPRNPTTTPALLSQEELQAMVLREEVAFVVRYQGKVVASTRLTPRSRAVESEQTVTVRAYRGRGLATMCKARALEWARLAGAEEAGTGGTVLNLGMLRVNAKLGYVPEPMWITWERLLPQNRTE